MSIIACLQCHGRGFVAAHDAANNSITCHPCTCSPDRQLLTVAPSVADDLHCVIHDRAGKHYALVPGEHIGVTISESRTPFDAFAPVSRVGVCLACAQQLFAVVLSVERRQPQASARLLGQVPQ